MKNRLGVLSIISVLLFSGMVLSCSEETTSENPGTETPGTDEPGTETPGTDEPGTETPGTDEPGSETPGTDEPGSETPGTDEPGTETPGTENPGTDEPGTETPGTETPGTDEPGTETPGTDEPGTETPGTDEPGTEPETKTLCGGEEVLELKFVNYACDLIHDQKGNTTTTTQPIYLKTDKGEYDASNAPCKLVWASSDDAVATIDDKGLIVGHKPGRAVLTVATDDGKFKGEFISHVINPSVLTQKITADMIYIKGSRLRHFSVMQGFDIAPDGTVYVTQNGNGDFEHMNRIFRLDMSKLVFDKYIVEDTMALKYAGHGQNLSIEDTDDGHYVWVGNYGTLWDGGNLYRFSQTISRFKYEGWDVAGADNKAIPPSEIEEHYYCPDRWNMQPALDVKNNRMAIWSQNLSFKDPAVYSFKLSDVKQLKPEMKTLGHAIKWGGVNSGETEKNKKVSANVKVLDPKMAVHKVSLTEQSQQGFAINNGKVYILEGAGNGCDSKTKSTAKVTVMTYDKKYHEAFNINLDLSNLKTLGLTNCGYMEPEGIRMIDGNLYIAFAARESGSNVRRVAVIRYNLMQ